MDKRRTRLFYPIAFAAFPVVSVYARNMTYVPPADLARGLATVLGIAGLIWAISGLLLRSAERGAAASTVLLAAFFGWSSITLGAERFLGWVLSNATPPEEMVAGLVVVASVFVAALAAWRFKAHGLANLLSAMVLIVAAGSAGLAIARDAAMARAKLPTVGAGTGSRERPDVFYIVLDGFGRPDVLRETMGLDLGWFERGLEARGFYVASRARTNYVQTELSLASSLNMEHLARLFPGQAADSGSRTPFRDAIADNAVIRRFRAAGYRVASVTTGFPPVSFPGTDEARVPRGLTMLETTLLSLTPLALSKATGTQYRARYESLEAAFRTLESLGPHGGAPKLVLVHILAPHPPFVYDAEGRFVRPRGPFGFWDGSDYMTYIGNQSDYRRGYSAQATYVARRMLRVVDRLQADTARRPVIVIQGDHGSKMGLHQSIRRETDLREAFSILNAYAVPASVRAELYPEITPVNSFRTILRVLFGDNLPNHPDSSWWSPAERPFALEEVTEELRGTDRDPSVNAP